MSNAFSQHLRHAMRLNRGRGRAYALQTRGRSRSLSASLVALEAACLPFARWFELRAMGRPGRQHLLELSFVPMEDLPHAAEPPALIEGPDRRQLVGARRVLGRLRREISAALRGGAMRPIVEACQDALRRLELLERRHGAHLAMSRHLVESLGRLGMVAERLGLGQDRFVRHLFRFQMAGLPLAPLLDARAQRLHARGAGLLVNDLPAIPFG